MHAGMDQPVSSRNTMTRIFRVSPIKTMVACLIIFAMAFPANHPAMAIPQTGQVYYVSPHGADTNPGTSSAKAWGTIQKCAKTLVAGDTCTVSAGNYPERVQITQSGMVNASITYLASGSVIMAGFTVNASAITITGFTITPTAIDSVDGWGIYVNGSNVDIETNTIQQAPRGGILLFSQPGKLPLNTNNTVKDNKLDGNGQVGIELHGQSDLIEGNKITGTLQSLSGSVGPDNLNNADGIHFFGVGHRIRGNTIQDITYKAAENANASIACFRTWSDDTHTAASNSMLEKNLCVVPEVAGVEQAAEGFVMDHAVSIILRNNIVRAYRVLDARNSPNLTVINNTFANDLGLPIADHPAIISLMASPNAMVDNNIFYDPLGAVFETDESSSGQGFTEDYNLVYRSDGASPAGTPGPHDRWQINPEFVDPSLNNFHLLPLSQAIDNGKSIISVTDDFDGNIRPQGQGYDIGSIEAPVVHMIFLPDVHTAP